MNFPCLALFRVPLSLLLLISMEVYWDVLNAPAQRKEEKVAILSYMPVSSLIGSKLLTKIFSLIGNYIYRIPKN